MENWSSPENFGPTMDQFSMEFWSGGPFFSEKIGPGGDHFFQGKLVRGDHFFQGILVRGPFLSEKIVWETNSFMEN